MAVAGTDGWIHPRRLVLLRPVRQRRGAQRQPGHPALQDLQVGDLMLTSPSEGFVVRNVDPERSLLLDLEHRGSRITSVLMLSPLPHERTRLVIRVRAYFRPRHRLFAMAFDIGDFLFMRRQMLGIKQRAERMVPHEEQRSSLEAASLTTD